MDAGNTGDDLVAQVRRGDYERFLAIQVAPEGKRAALYAMAALNSEIASVAEIVSEALIGHIRLAWWREALEEIEAGKTPRNHPLVLALADVQRVYPRVFPFLYEMIEARGADLDESLIADETSWRSYCDHTAGALHMAFGFVLDEACARENETLIRDAAQGCAMIGLVRAIPYMAAQGFMRFPAARLEKFQLTSLAPTESLRNFVREIIADAENLIAIKKYNPKLQALHALVVLAQLGQHQLARVSHDPYRLRPAKLRAVWRVIRLKYCPLTCF